MGNEDQIIKKGRRKLFSPPMLTSSNDFLFPSLSSTSKLLFSQSLPRPMLSSTTPAIAGDILPDEVVSHPRSQFSGSIPAAPSLGEELFLTQIFQNRKSTDSNDDPQIILGDTTKPEFLFPSDTNPLLLSQNQNFLSSHVSSCARTAGGVSSDVGVAMDRLRVDSSNLGFSKKRPEFHQKVPDDNSFLLSNYDSQVNYSSELNSQLDPYRPSSEAISIEKFIQPERQSDLFKSGNFKGKMTFKAISS